MHRTFGDAARDHAGMGTRRDEVRQQLDGQPVGDEAGVQEAMDLLEQVAISLR